MFTTILDKLNCDFFAIDVLVLLPNSHLLLLFIVPLIFIVRFLCFKIFFVFSIIKLCFFNEFLLSFLIILFSFLSLRLLRMFSILVSSFRNLPTLWTLIFILLMLTALLLWLIFLLEMCLPLFLLFKLGVFAMPIIFNKLPCFCRFLLGLWLLFSRSDWHWHLRSLYDLRFLLGLKNLFDLRFMLHHNVLHLFLLLFLGGKFLWLKSAHQIKTAWVVKDLYKK